jgi:tellurite resistance protein
MYKDFFKKSRELVMQAADGVSNLINNDFLDALIACGVAISRCDGDFDSNEKRKIEDFISAESSLAKFSKEKVGSLIKKYEAIDSDVCEVFAIKAASKVKGVEDKKYLVRSLVVLAKADGEIDPKEKAFINSVCVELSVNLSDFLK